jgi:hypothetical protein
VLGQLGNRVQHALRAFTRRDQKAVRAAAETFRANPRFDAEQAITELGLGEALVSTLQGKGIPSVVDRTLIRPPSSRLGPAKKSERAATLADSSMGGRYDRSVDRESAYEKLSARAEKAAEEAARAEREAAEAKARESSSSRGSAAPRRRRSNRQGIGEAMAKSVVRSVGRTIGRELVRGLLGSFLKRR